MEKETQLRFAGYGTAVLRAALGSVFLVHGLAKVFVFTVPGTAAFFEGAGFPGFLALPVIFAELIGGTLLVAGLFTRWAAIALTPVLLGATMTHWGNGFLFSNSGGGWEFPAFLIAVSAALALEGDGRWSLGAWLDSARGGESAVQATDPTHRAA